MRMNYKKITNFITINTAIFTIAATTISQKVYADNLFDPSKVKTPINIDTSAAKLITTTITIFIIFTGILALFYLIFGGIKYITSSGDQKAITNARNHITAAIVGLVLVFISFMIVRMVGIFFGIETKIFDVPF